MACKRLSIFSLSIFGIVLMTSQAQPQPNLKPSFKLDIPFEFLVGDHALPAGLYTVQLLLHSQPGAGTIEVMSFRAGDHIRQTVVADLHVRRGTDRGTRLVFKRYGDESFLSEILAGEALLVLPMSKRQKEASQQLAASEIDLLITTDAAHGVAMSTTTAR